MMNIAHVTTSKVWFYVNGNIEEVYRLISNLAGLGKKVVDGCGWFHSVSVEKMDKDYSLSKDGLAMRPLPCSFGYKSEDVMMLAWKAPYWDKRNVTACVPPGAKVYGN